LDPVPRLLPFRASVERASRARPADASHGVLFQIFAGEAKAFSEKIRSPPRLDRRSHGLRAMAGELFSEKFPRLDPTEDAKAGGAVGRALDGLT